MDLMKTRASKNFRHPRAMQKSGFTLVEVLSAVLLLSIGLLAVLTATRAARDTQQRALYLSIGNNIAQSKIDYIRSAPIDTIDAMDGSTSDSSLPKGNSIVTLVSRYPDNTETNIYKAAVTITWPEQKGTRRICYETLITRK